MAVCPCVQAKDDVGMHSSEPASAVKDGFAVDPAQFRLARASWIRKRASSASPVLGDGQNAWL